ncbi:MAG: hypothetical protein DRP01_09835 [Archaeoglobales archaeon]|nr:MAG: hypothetical protein DRP01_09835 [Archaeoglobales archaeon]
MRDDERIRLFEKKGIFNKAIERNLEVSKMEDRRLERFYLSLFKTSEKRWRRIVWRANKELYGMTPWDLAKKWGRNWQRE